MPENICLASSFNVSITLCVKDGKEAGHDTRRQGYRPWVSAPNPLLLTCKIATIAATVLSREMDCVLAILRGRIETWKEDVDRNLSWLNQLVSNCRFKWVVGGAKCQNSPYPSPLPRGEGACLRLDGRYGLARF